MSLTVILKGKKMQTAIFLRNWKASETSSKMTNPRGARQDIENSSRTDAVQGPEVLRSDKEKTLLKINTKTVNKSSPLPNS